MTTTEAVFLFVSFSKKKEISSENKQSTTEYKVVPMRSMFNASDLAALFVFDCLSPVSELLRPGQPELQLRTIKAQTL